VQCLKLNLTLGDDSTCRKLGIWGWPYKLNIAPMTKEANIKNEPIDTTKEFDNEEIRMVVRVSKRFCHWEP
jgi:hypothetical protein